jgi:CheY-like chemotaxis protein
MKMNLSRRILFVEDDQDDRELIHEAFKHVSSDVEAFFAENGLEAISYLSGIQQNDNHLPCLIVLDLNMPFLDGRQTFDKIKNELKLGSVPVVIFTSSQNPHDKALFESRGAEFITKPLNFDYMKKIITHMVSLCCNHC